MASGQDKPNPEINPGMGMKIALKGISSKFSDVSHLPTSTLNKWLEEETENIILLDTRAEEEFTISHIPRAIRVDHDTVNMNNLLQKLPPCNDSDTKNTKIVCYCSIGYRSSLMAQKLHQHFQHIETERRPEVYNLEGSIFKWANESRPLVDSENQPTIFAHHYNALWGKLLHKDLRKP